MGCKQSKQKSVVQQLPKTEDGVPIALLDLSKVENFRQWLVFVRAIRNTKKDRQKQLQRIHEFTLSCYLYLKSTGLKDDGSTTAKLIPEVAKAIQDLEESSMPELKTLVTWQGLSVDWLINEFFEHPYLQEVRKFGCEAWHFRKWGVVELIRQCQCKELGSLSGPFVEHLDTVRHMWKATASGVAQNHNTRGPDAGCAHEGAFGLLSQSLQKLHSALFSQPKGTPTIFISYTGAYTVEHLVEALGQLSPSEYIWMDIFCVDQFAWTGKSRLPEMKEFKETFVQDLQHQIGRIRHTALILQNWDDVMVTLQKLWVLWEIFNTANANAKLSVLLSPKQVKDFIDNCMLSNEKFEEIQNSLAKIDARQAETDDDGDRNAIFKKMSVRGFDQVNNRVSQVIRQWQIGIGEQALGIQQQATQLPSWSMLINLGRLYQMQGIYNRAQLLFNEALKYGNVFGEHHPATLASMNNLASVLESQGQYQEAEPLHRQALKQNQQVLGEHHPDTLSSMNNLGSVLESQGQYKEAEPLFRQALKQRQKVLGGRHPDTLSSMNNLASVLSSQGNYQEAEPLYHQALKQRQKVLVEHHPDTVTSMNNLASVLESQGQYKEAELLLRQALEQRQKVLGEHHPDTLSSINNLASVLRSQGQYQEAEPLYRQAFKQSQIILGEHHPDTLTSMNNLAGVLYSEGQYQEAETLYCQALKQSQMILGKHHPVTLSSMNNVASVHHSQGKHQEAEPLYREAFKQSQQVLGEHHPDTLSFMDNLASVLHSQGQYQEAELLCRKAFEQRRKVLGERCPDVLISMNNLASILESQGKYQEAEPFFRQAFEHSHQVLGEHHPHTLKYFVNLVNVLKRQGHDQEN